AVGGGGRRAGCRTWARNRSWMRIQTPAWRHGQKSPETVFSGGKSCGRIRHGRPPTHPSKIAWMTSRKLGSRGRPPGFSGGSQSLISFHGLFVRSVGDLFFRLQCPYRLDGQVVKRSGSKQVQRFSSQLLIRNFSNSFLVRLCTKVRSEKDNAPIRYKMGLTESSSCTE